MARDLDKTVAQPFVDAGASWANRPKKMSEQCDMVITCLTSPAASVTVMKVDDGILVGLSDGKIWAEMSITDIAEMARLGAIVKERVAGPVDCPVSGVVIVLPLVILLFLLHVDGPCLKKILPVLAILGRRVLHTGGLGTASV